MNTENTETKDIFDEMVEDFMQGEMWDMDTIKKFFKWLKNSPEKVLDYLKARLNVEIPDDSRLEFLRLFFRILVIHRFCEPDDGLLNDLLFSDEINVEEIMPKFGGQGPRKDLSLPDDLHVPDMQFYSAGHFISLVEFSGWDDTAKSGEKEFRIPPEKFLLLLEKNEKYLRWLSGFRGKEEKIFADPNKNLSLELLLERLKTTPSTNISFRSSDGVPTRYGRNLFGQIVVIICFFDNGSQIQSMPITLTEKVYEKIHQTGSKTND